MPPIIRPTLLVTVTGIVFPFSVGTQKCPKLAISEQHPALEVTQRDVATDLKMFASALDAMENLQGSAIFPYPRVTTAKPMNTCFLHNHSAGVSVRPSLQQRDLTITTIETHYNQIGKRQVKKPWPDCPTAAPVVTVPLRPDDTCEDTGVKRKRFYNHKCRAAENKKKLQQFQ